MASLSVAIGEMRYILSVISALAFLHVARTASFGAPVPMTASNCPVLLALEPSHADRYVVVFGARTATTIGVTMTLYTKAGSVILVRDAVAIDKTLPQPPIPFRSTALAVAQIERRALSCGDASCDGGAADEGVSPYLQDHSSTNVRQRSHSRAGSQFPKDDCR